MGYYTQFELIVMDVGDEDENAIAEYEIPYFNYSISEMERIGRTEQTKWYEHINDMLVLSNKFPTALFRLEGYGEDSYELDIWKAYFRNGKYEKVNAVLTFPEVDLTKL